MSNKVKGLKWLTVFWSLLIFIVSIVPPGSLKPLEWESFISMDKIGHFVAYTVLCLLMSIVGWAKAKGVVRHKVLWTIVLLGSFYGLFIETIQLGFINERNFDVFDLIANIIGSFTGSFSIHILKHKLKWMLH